MYFKLSNIYTFYLNSALFKLAKIMFNSFS